MVMAMYSLWRKEKNPTKEDIQQSLDSNLCRCTGSPQALRGDIDQSSLVHRLGERGKCARSKKRSTYCRKAENSAEAVPTARLQYLLKSITSTDAAIEGSSRNQARIERVRVASLGVLTGL